MLIASGFTSGYSMVESVFSSSSAYIASSSVLEVGERSPVDLPPLCPLPFSSLPEATPSGLLASFGEGVLTPFAPFLSSALPPCPFFGEVAFPLETFLSSAFLTCSSPCGVPPEWFPFWLNWETRSATTDLCCCCLAHEEEGW